MHVNCYVRSAKHSDSGRFSRSNLSCPHCRHPVSNTYFFHLLCSGSPRLRLPSEANRLLGPRTPWKIRSGSHSAPTIFCDDFSIEVHMRGACAREAAEFRPMPAAVIAVRQHSVVGSLRRNMIRLQCTGTPDDNANKRSVICRLRDFKMRPPRASKLRSGVVPGSHPTRRCRPGELPSWPTGPVSAPC